MTSKTPLMTGLIAGAAVGAAAGLLLAPKPGKVTRRFVAMRAGKIRRKAVHYAAHLRRNPRRGERVSDTNDDR